MNREGIVSLLNKVLLPVIALPRLIPEGEKLPAAAYSHISGIRNRNTLAANVDAKGDTWRIALVCNTLEEVDELTKKFESIDNTSDEHFKNIFIESIFDGRDINTINADFFEAYVDIRVIDR